MPESSDNERNEERPGGELSAGTPVPASSDDGAPGPDTPKLDAPKSDAAKPPAPAGADGDRGGARTDAANREASGVLEPYFIHPDSGAASASQRLRLVPPNGKPQPWWVRHRKILVLAELIATGIFFLLAVYFLLQWLFYDPWKVAVEPGRWKQIVVHHTATAGGSPESIDRYHRNVNKWENGLGYHFIIGNGNGMPDGQIHTGNRWLRQLNGAHVRMKGTDKGNSFSIGIALVGNFQDKPPTEKQLESLRRLLRYLVGEYGIPRENIIGHGSVSANHTDCPGRLLVVKAVVETL